MNGYFQTKYNKLIWPKHVCSLTGNNPRVYSLRGALMWSTVAIKCTLSKEDRLANAFCTDEPLTIGPSMLCTNMNNASSVNI